MKSDKKIQAFLTHLVEQPTRSAKNLFRQRKTRTAGLLSRKCGLWRFRSALSKQCAVIEKNFIGATQILSMWDLSPGFYKQLTWRPQGQFYDGKSMKNDNNQNNWNLNSLQQKLLTIQNISRSLAIAMQNLQGAERVIRRNLENEPNGLESGLIKCFLASAYANIMHLDLKILDAQQDDDCKLSKPSLRLVSDKSKESFTDTDYPGI